MKSFKLLIKTLLGATKKGTSIELPSAKSLQNAVYYDKDLSEEDLLNLGRRRVLSELETMKQCKYRYFTLNFSHYPSNITDTLIEELTDKGFKVHNFKDEEPYPNFNLILVYW